MSTFCLWIIKFLIIPEALVTKCSGAESPTRYPWLRIISTLSGLATVGVTPSPNIIFAKASSFSGILSKCTFNMLVVVTRFGAYLCGSSLNKSFTTFGTMSLCPVKFNNQVLNGLMDNKGLSSGK